MHSRMSGKTLSFVAILFLWSALPRIDALPVFPGAEGFGSETNAGRGGTIIRVTNLNASGPGSLDAALRASGPRIVIFEVGGTIDWTQKGPTVVRNGNLTVAGQTAPSPGITIRGAGIIIVASDVLLRHIRIRVGDDPAGPPPDNRDALDIEVSGGLPTRNVVVDHCSFSWAIDGNMDLWYSGVSNVTISNTITSEALMNSLHSKGEHSTGMLIGDGIQDVSVLRSLFASNRSRNPILKGGTRTVLINNVMYNAGYANINLGDYEGSGAIRTSLVGNVAIAGPDTPAGARYLVRIDSTVSGASRAYVSDSRSDSSSGHVLNYAASTVLASSSPIGLSGFSILPSSQTEARVLERAGARPADRDAVDSRVIAGVASRSGRQIDSPSDVGGWPLQGPVYRALTVPPDPHGDSDGDGYSNVEEWLHRMALDVEGLGPPPEEEPAPPEDPPAEEEPREPTNLRILS